MQHGASAERVAVGSKPRARLITWMQHGVPDRAANFNNLLTAVTTEQVAEVSRKYLVPTRGAVVIAGPSDVLRPQIANLQWTLIRESGPLGTGSKAPW
jgi:hypothetical protein